MNAIKSAQADVKEKIQNVTAKVDEKRALSKASATAKAERKGAEDKAGKHDAKANYYNKQAEILREYDQKKVSHAAAKEETKTALNQKKADKHTNKADKHTNKADKHANTTGDIVGEDKTDDNVDLNTSATAPADPTFDDHKSNTRDAPASSDLSERAPEAQEEDVNATTPVDGAGSDPVNHDQVPMHGSGVPTHSTLHNDSQSEEGTHDVRTTHTMEGSPNNGSYM